MIPHTTITGNLSVYGALATEEIRMMGHWNAKAKHVSPDVLDIILCSASIIYEGSETAPFEAYIRWSRGKVILASVCNTDNRMGVGRLPLILGALERLRPVVIVENVCNPRLWDYLLRRGYTERGPHSSLVDNLTWTRPSPIPSYASAREEVA